MCDWRTMYKGSRPLLLAIGSVECLAGRRCHNEARALTEANSGRAFTLAVRAHDDFIAIVQEAAFLPCRENERLCATARQLQKTTLRASIRAGHRAAREEITWTQVAAIARMVREHLRRSPVHICERGGADTRRAHP